MTAVHDQFQIGTLVDLEGESYKIINSEKPYKHFAGHYTIQSVQTSRVVKVFKHQLCQSEPVNVEQFQEESQSDEELFNLNDDDLNIESADPPQNAVDEQDEENIVTVPAKKRFKSCSEIELDKISQARNEKNTDKQTQWGVKLFRGWLQENDHNLQFENLEESTLNERLRVFYGSLRTKQGLEYSKSALVGIRAAISRHLNSSPHNREFKIMTDRAFMTSNHVLLGLIKLLKRDGKDTTVHKKAISQGDIEKLYSCGVFNVDSPDTLQNKVFWDVMLNFGRRGQEGLPELKSNSYHKLTDDKGMKYYTMAYNECDKTHHGVDGKENIKETRMYERPNDLNCPVHSLDLYMYLSKLSPKCSAFFQQTLVNPRPDCWYAAQPIGKNKLASWMSRISKSADLSKIYTNHCIKATVATVLSRQGVDLLKIMSVTGHRNVKSLESYINEPTDNERRILSSALQEGTIPSLGSATNVTTLTSNSRNSVCSSSDAGRDIEVRMSKEQMSNSALNIMNNASITGGTFTFNIVQKEENH